MAVDFFLRSLAEPSMTTRSASSCPAAARTALSLKEIKAAGGMTMVQDPQSAQHDGMPRSAIASADCVLRPSRWRTSAAAPAARRRRRSQPQRATEPVSEL